LQQHLSPMGKIVIAVFGLPGSGKTFFADNLAKNLGIESFNTDKIRKQYNIQLYDFEAKSRVYDIMLDKIRESLKRNDAAIMDGTLYRAKMRSRLKNRIKIMGYQMVFIEVWAAEPLIKERVSVKRPYSDADYEVYQKIKKEYEPLNEEHLVMESTNNNLLEMIGKAKEHLLSHYEYRANSGSS